MSEHKKVILLGSTYPLRGGLASFNERIIREYQSQGYDAEIYTFSLQYPGFLFPGKTQYSDDPPPADLKISVKVNSVNPLNWIKIGYELKKKKPDLLIVKFWLPFMAPCFGTIARIVKSNKFTSVISIVDNIIPHEHRPGDRILAKYWVNCVDGFVAMSKNVLDDLGTFTQKPALFCPHPVYDNYGEAIPKEEAKRLLNLDQNINYILFFGFIRDYKGLDLLLKALASPKLKDLPVKVLIAGEFYSDPKSYHDLIAELNLSERVVLATEFIPESLVSRYFCASDLVVQPYKSATQSGVTQIAYHFGKPMIITNVGGLEEFVKNDVVGYVVNPEPDEIAEAIFKYFDGGKEVEFSKNVEKEKLRFTWSNMLKTIDSLLVKKNI
jgi:glycosyltransferase involved in cell wall biosynthesis